VVLRLEPVEALVDAVEVAIDLVESGVDPLFEGVDSFPDDTLHVGHDDLAMEAGQDRQEVFGHVPILLQAPWHNGSGTAWADQAFDPTDGAKTRGL
jgi:hypothetical protein